MPQKNQQNVTLIFQLSVGKGMQADKLLTENVIFGEKILEIEQALKWYTVCPPFHALLKSWIIKKV